VVAFENSRYKVSFAESQFNGACNDVVERSWP